MKYTPKPLNNWVFPAVNLSSKKLSNCKVRGGMFFCIPLGCKTAPAPDAGFLQEPEKMAPQKERFPFDRVWVKPDVQKEDYDYLVIAPVNTQAACKI